MEESCKKEEKKKKKKARRSQKTRGRGVKKGRAWKEGKKSGRKGWCAPILRRGSIDLQWAKVWRNPTPISRRYPAAWTIILVDKGYGGGLRRLSHTLVRRQELPTALYAADAARVLGVARGHVRTCVGNTPAHPHRGARNFEEENSNVPPTRPEEVQRPEKIFICH